MDQTLRPQDIKGILRRQWKLFIAAFCPVFLVAVFIAFILPPVYMSETTILIEEQQIPQDYVRTTVTSFVEERLQIITQQVMSRTKLLEIIQQFNLYKDELEQQTTDTVIEKMRKNIKLEKISAGGEGGNSNTIAFTLSYEGESPATVQKVTNVLASLYLEENVKARARSASTTTDFLQKEMEGIGKEIDNLEEQISKFKEAHMGELPEYTAVNLQTIERLNRDLDQLNMSLRTLQERKIYLQSQLAAINPNIPILTPEGTAAPGPQARLTMLQMQLAALEANHSSKHPDVIRLRREIAHLERLVQRQASSNAPPVQTGEDPQVGLIQAQAELIELKSKFGPKHPDVIKKQKEVAALAQRTSNGGETPAAEQPTNPTYISLQTQLTTTELDIAVIQKQIPELKQKIERYQGRIESAPHVEKEYNQLIRDYETARHRYNETMAKLMEARVAQGMEETQKGERFEIVEPANLPEEPYKPNRTGIIMVGLVLALGAGAGLAFMRETLNNSVKTPEALAQSGLLLLSTVPLMATAQQKKKKRMIIGFLFLATLGVLVVGLIVVHFWIIPLDILWIKINRRIMLWS